MRFFLQIPPELKQSELMELAGKISSTAMQIIAVQKLGFDISEVKTLSSANREDQCMMKFELLDRWKNRDKKNNRQVIICIRFLCIAKKSSLESSRMVDCSCL